MKFDLQLFGRLFVWFWAIGMIHWCGLWSGTPDLDREPAEGEWSARQVIEHILQVEEAYTDAA